MGRWATISREHVRSISDTCPSVRLLEITSRPPCPWLNCPQWLRRSLRFLAESGRRGVHPARPVWPVAETIENQTSPSRSDYSVDATRPGARRTSFNQSWRLWSRGWALRLPITRCAVPLSPLPWWCLYLSLYIAYRWPHSSISHNSAARWESRGPLHSRVIFHCSSSPCYSSFAEELSFYCKYPSRLSAPFRVRVALQQGRL